MGRRVDAVALACALVLPLVACGRASEVPVTAEDVTRSTADVADARSTTTTAEPSTTTTEPVDPEREASIAEEAEYFGMTMEEARIRVQIADDARYIQRVAADRYPDTFAGLWIGTDRTAGLHLAFTSDAAAKVADVIGDYQYADRVLAHDAVLSLREIGAILERMVIDRSALQDGEETDLPPEIVATGGQYGFGEDLETNEIVVDSVEITPGLEDAFRATYTQRLRVDDRHISPA